MAVQRHSDLTPVRQGKGVSYSEVRDWAVWLQLFTASDLADAMGVSDYVGRRAVVALLWHGICEDTGEVDGRGEQIISYVPLPPGPTHHFTHPPEWRTCEMELLSPRGFPVRLVDNTERRNQMQGTKGARVRIKQRDRAYEARIEARQKRREQDAARRRAEAEGRINRQRGKTRTHIVE